MKRILNVLITVTLLVVNVTLAQTAYKVSGFHHIESVATDGKFLYAADIGKELNPAAKDGDGRIYKLNMNGKIIDSLFFKETLHAPKGLAYDKNILYTVDVDRLIAFDLKTGKTLFSISFGEGISFLNDVAIVDKETIYVSATDKSKIYKVNTALKSYAEFTTNNEIAGVNGLFYDKQSKRLYVNGFGSDNKPNGIVGFINTYSGEFTRLGDNIGYFDGIWLCAQTLYVSNWVAFEKKGIIQTIDIPSGKVEELKMDEPVAGPADFTIYKNQLIVPEMMTGAIYFINLKK